MKVRTDEDGSVLITDILTLACQSCRKELSTPFYFCPEKKECYCEDCSIKAAYSHFHITAESQHDEEGTLEHQHLCIKEVQHEDSPR